MKFKYLLPLLITSTALAAGPDCLFHYRFTNIPGEHIDGKTVLNPGTSPTINNFGSSCTAYTWSVSYAYTGLSSLSVQLEDAPLTSSVNVPGTFVVFNGQTITGTNPLTSTNGSLWTGIGYYPFIRINTTTFIGTGAADIFLYGWTSPNIFSISSSGGGSGSVTSVGLSLPSIFSISGSPVTSIGTLVGTFTNQAQNTFFAAPSSGLGTPNFRLIVSSDIPTLNQSTTGNAATATAFDHNPTDCVGGQFANAIDAGGNLTCTTPAGGTSPLTTKGDIYTRSASADSRLAVGTDGQVLVADSTQTTGLKWAAAAGSGTVTTSGTPTSTQYAKFTGSTIITGQTGIPGGDITGANTIPASTLPLATTGAFGAVKPDGTTVTISGGTISAVTTGGLSLVYIGILSGRPTCDVSHQGIAFITDASLGQQENYCSNKSGTYQWIQQNLIDTTLTNTAGTFGVNLSQFCQYTNSCTIGSTWDFSTAPATRPIKVGASDPGTCAIGDFFLNTTTPALKFCSATNTWTIAGSGGGFTFDAVTANQSVGQSTAGSFADVTVLFDTNLNITTGTLHSTISNTGNFVASQTGWWAGACNVVTDNTSVTNIGLMIEVNGTKIAGNQVASGAANGYGMSLPYFYHLTSGDIITCVVNSNNGFTTSSANNIGKTNMSFYLVHP